MPPSSPSVLKPGQAAEEAGVLPLGCQQEVQATETQPAQPLTLTPPLITITPGQYPSPTLTGHFQTSLGSLPVGPRKSHHVI